MRRTEENVQDREKTRVYITEKEMAAMIEQSTRLGEYPVHYNKVLYNHQLVLCLLNVLLNVFFSLCQFQLVMEPY